MKNISNKQINSLFYNSKEIIRYNLYDLDNYNDSPCENLKYFIEQCFNGTYYKPDFAFTSFNNKKIIKLKNKNYLPRDIDNNLNYLINMSNIAPYGDLKTHTTKIDPSVRKGFEISLKNNYVLYIKDKILFKFAKKFAANMGYTNIDIIPYKLNIYEPGDFFKSHVDTPEANLLGTMILHMYGDYECMKINDHLWKQEDGNLLMFYSDQPHEILPVKSLRITLILKVLIKINVPVTIDDFKYNEIYKNLCNNIDFTKNFYIILKHGYILDDIKLNNITLKGNDLIMYEIAKKYNFNISYTPILLTIRTYYNEDGYLYDYNMKWYTDIDDGCYKFIRHKEISLDEFDLNSSLPYSISIHKISNSILYEIFGLHISKSIYPSENDNCYFMGSKGYYLGELDRKQIYIGNQSTGSANDDMYFTLMMTCQLNNDIYLK